MKLNALKVPTHLRKVRDGVKYEIIMDDSQFWFAQVGHDAHTEEQAEHFAKLFARSPQLLEAAKEMLEWLKTSRTETMQSHIKRWEAAIQDPS